MAVACQRRGSLSAAGQCCGGPAAGGRGQGICDGPPRRGAGPRGAAPRPPPPRAAPRAGGRGEGWVILVRGPAPQRWIATRDAPPARLQWRVARPGAPAPRPPPPGRQRPPPAPAPPRRKNAVEPEGDEFGALGEE